MRHATLHTQKRRTKIGVERVGSGAMISAGLRVVGWRAVRGVGDVRVARGAGGALDVRDFAVPGGAGVRAV